MLELLDYENELYEILSHQSCNLYPLSCSTPYKCLHSKNIPVGRSTLHHKMCMFSFLPLNKS